MFLKERYNKTQKWREEEEKYISNYCNLEEEEELYHTLWSTRSV
jgi:hypothetical protein